MPDQTQLAPVPAYQRVLRIIFYTLSGASGVVGLFLMAALFIVKVSCKFFNSTSYTAVEHLFPMIALPILPFFIAQVIISAKRSQWKHLIGSIVILVLLIVGFYFYLVGSMFYCFFDQIPDEFFYWGPH